MASTVKTYSFEDKNNATKKTELLIKEWYEDNDWLVLDVSNMKGYQEKDIDLIAYYDTVESQVKIEIKSDSYQSPNYFAETISNTSKNTLGCWMKTEADYLMYYFEKDKEVHVIPVREAQQYIKDNYDNLKTAKVGTKDKRGRILYYTEGKLVNKRKLQKAIDIQIYDLSEYVLDNYLDKIS